MFKGQGNHTRKSLVIVGAGLSGSLLALLLRRRGIDNFIIIDKSHEFNAHQIWSFYGADIPEELKDWMHSLPIKIWNGYSVKFMDYKRQFSESYHSLRSSDFFNFVKSQLLPEQLKQGVGLAKIDEDHVVLSDGSVIYTDFVFDARGIKNMMISPHAYQKFVGLELEFEKPHHLALPIIKDVRVSQIDGYRFIYSLPFSPTRMLVEDTRYSMNPDINIEKYTEKILKYAVNQFGVVKEIKYQESAALPIPLDMSFLMKERKSNYFPIGMCGGLFHPVTGYSFPIALEVAQIISSQFPWHLDSLNKFYEFWNKQCRYYLTLNKMLFGACAAKDRYKIFSRFYLLDDDLISRFYSGKSSSFDKMRLLVGKPPVPIVSAFKSLTSNKWMNEVKQ